jgi:hypothetical protein
MSTAGSSVRLTQLPSSPLVTSLMASSPPSSPSHPQFSLTEMPEEEELNRVFLQLLTELGIPAEQQQKVY